MDCFVYMLANATNTVLYTGVTSNLPKRFSEHRLHLDPDSFTARYDATRLVWYEHTPDIRSAIEREKQIKSWRRAKKNALVETMNPGWEDLAESLELV